MAGDLSASPVRALVFDLDGTLTDSDPLHHQAFAAALALFGLAMSEERYRTEVSGRTNAAICRLLFPHGTQAEHRRFAEGKESRFRDLASRLERLPGLTYLLAFAAGRGLPTALVTNAPRANAEHMLRGLDLEGGFTVMVLAEEVDRPKPDPMPYRLAAERLGIAPGEAVAFEDSVAGVRSASAAGLVTFGVTTSQTAATLRSAGADHAIADFEDPLLWDLLEGSMIEGTADSRPEDMDHAHSI